MIEITPGERFRAAVEEWAEARMMDEADAMATKAEQALLEIEHLVAGADEVTFEVEGSTIRYDPSEEVRSLLASEAERAGVDVETVATLYVNLYANAFLDTDSTRPPNAPPTE